MIKILDDTYKATDIRYINEDNIAYLQSKIKIDRNILMAINKILKLNNIYDEGLQRKELDKILETHPVTDIDYWKGLNPNVEIETTIILNSGYEITLKQDEVNAVIKALEKKVNND